MTVLICAMCGTKKEYKHGFKTYCSRSCASKDRCKEIKPRINHRKIKQLASQGMKRADIAEVVGCSIGTVQRVITMKKINKSGGKKDEI